MTYTLAAAARDAFVTVETDDGQVYVGTVSRNADGTYSVHSGYRGRPAILDPNDVVEILAVDAENPHVER